MAAIALSPPHSYSIVSMDCGSSQPVPVVPATTRILRLKASVRCSSCTAIFARPAAVSAHRGRRRRGSAPARARR